MHRPSEEDVEGAARIGLHRGKRECKVCGGKESIEQLGTVAIFDVVVAEDDLQRTVDKRLLLHRARWVDWT